MSAEQKNVVIFGAGSTGRGHVGQLAHASGYRLVFIDRDPALLRDLWASKQYTVRLVGEQVREVDISGYRVLDVADEPAVIEAICQADLVLTAVRPENIPSVAGPLARGLVERAEGGKDAPLNVVACENMIGGSTTLKGYVAAALPQGYDALLDKHFAFPDAMIARVVPSRDPGSLRLEGEDYSEWPVDRAAWLGPDPQIATLELVDNLPARLERKLYMHNTGHAVCGYLAHMKGYELMCDAIADPWIADITRHAMMESGEALVRRHGFDRLEINAYREGLFPRVASRLIKDPVTRVIRSPLRKLGRHERLVGPACLCLEYGASPEYLGMGMAALLDYHAPDDPESDRLQQALRQHGIAWVFSDLIGVEEAYRRPLEGAVKRGLARLMMARVQHRIGGTAR